ncbi:SMI1/KNR4 family protein [Streptomyces sp. NPDC057702]|uniref:SMI1/KNR4 family protein n=1 Tax=unclassified Streptomyces TaxID=2593676 RepID=UPI00367B7FFA
MTGEPNAEESAALVAAAWARVEGWLRAHAPASAALLRPGAGGADIDAVERSTGLVFPPALRAWYGLHDGIDDPEEGKSWWPAGFLPGGQGWYRLSQVESDYVVHTRDWEREPGRIPISSTPGDMRYGRYVDARPNEPSHGNLGRWAADEEPEPIPTFTSGWPLGAWLTAFADAIEQGRCLIEPDGRRDEYKWPALTVSGGLTWVDPRDDPPAAEIRTLLHGPR